MFPTFISILDIQSWWEVPSIAHFCSLFRTAFNLLDFDIEDLEEALLTDGTEESSWLQELIVRLLSGCLPNNEISTFNYQMFLRRLFRQKCQEHDRYNPFNTDIDFQLLPLRTKVDILYALCDFRLDADDVLDQLKNLEADSLRVEPLGYDNNNSAYWYFYGTRLYREDFQTKNNKKKSVWQVICFTEDDWFQLNKKFKKSTVKCERQLHRTLSENFLPELPRLFREKERLARKRVLDNQPRRTSRRLKKENTTEKEEIEIPKELSAQEEEKQKKLELEIKRREAYERRNRLKEEEEQSEDNLSEKSEGRYEMAGAKTKIKKSKGRQRKISNSSTNDNIKGTKRKKGNENVKSSSSSSSTPTTVGRQTNNSLAAATGQIVIQPVSHPHKKKLKTSQVFRQTDEDLITGMHKILDYVKNHEDAWPFTDPVDEDYAPNYYSVIRKPMDLQRMEERLDAGYYKNFTSFRNDFQLIVDNCRLYNGAENEYTEMVDNLSKVFERATEKFLDQISSSDDEIAVEYPNKNSDSKDIKKSKIDNKTSTKRKPSLVTKTDKKRDRSLSEESLDRRSDSLDKMKRKKIENKIEKSANKKISKIKRDKNEIKKDIKEKKNSKINNNNNKHKKDKINKSPDRNRSISRSPLRSYSSSPPPSSCPSSPDNRFDFFPKKHKSHNFNHKDISNKGKEKQKSEKYKELFEKTELEPDLKKEPDKGLLSPKPKDKHNKLRETIEKLKAKSEISNKLNDNEFCFDLDAPKENREKSKKDEKNKNKKDKLNKQNSKKDLEYDDNSTLESLQSDNKKSKKNNTAKNANNKNAAIEALTIATEQTLKDINKWLDDTPKYPEYSSESNSPSYNNLDEFDTTNKIENNKKPEKPIIKKDTLNKDVKRRTFNRDPSKFIKRREIQRTIDRLQPGKSKGNLLSNVQNTKQNDELFPLGPLKNKDTKNSLIVKTDDNAPKLSLGSVLDSFGRHKFIEDGKKSEENQDKKENDENLNKTKEENQIKDERLQTLTILNEPKESSDRDESSSVNLANSTTSTTTTTSTTSTSMMSGATPNLSAWFKAFGAPKVQSSQKKSDTKADNSKDNEKSDDTTKTETRKDDNLGKTPIPELSPNNDSPVACHGQPIPRQRKISTGSSVSERSSFSQDMDSPRVGIDERLGAYPAPYPSPLHRSPSGASPVMVSPRPDVSPKSAPYPPFNGQIRVGFYQDTVSTKSSPDKSCSPRDNPQSPYPSHPEHVYTPNTTQNINYSYPNSPYYSHTPNYSNTNPTPPYSSENINNSYYDTSKSLTDQYQAKTNQNYGADSPSNISSPVQHSPNMIETYRQDDQNKDKINQSAMFPVKKRAYNESDQINNHRYDTQEYMNRNLQPIDHSNNIQNTRNDQEPMKQYIHQNIPDPKPLSVQTNIDYNKGHSTISPQHHQQSGPPPQQLHDLNGMRNYQNAPPPPPAPPPYGSYGNEQNYPLNVPTRTAPQDLDRKYTNMGYGGSEVCFSRGMPQYSRPDLNYSPRPNTNLQQAISNQQLQQSESPLRYTNPNPHLQMNYKNMEMDANPQHAHSNYTNVSANNRNELSNRLSQPPSEVSIPRPTYNTHLEMEQMGLRGNLTNLSHIVDRYNNDERMLSGLQPTSQYYGDKNMGTPHIFNKPVATSSSTLPMFNQPMQSYNQNNPVPTSMYNRQLTELSPVGSSEPLKSPNNAGHIQEKKTKKRKNAKNVQSVPVSESTPPPNNQGFQSYAGLKTNPSMEPSAISLKTTSVVPGSAFNFGPTPTGLSIGSGLYGDKDPYPNFLDDFRTAPNYYMAAAAAAHHRSTPETIPIDKQTPRVVAHHSSTSTAASATTTTTPSSSSSIPTSSSSTSTPTTSQPGPPPPPPNYPFIGAPQPRPPSYPLGSPFIPPPPPPSQAQLMDPAGSPLYQHYLQAGVLNQGLLGPPGPYPPGYHPALSMRQPYDSMTRPSWL